MITFLRPCRHCRLSSLRRHRLRGRSRRSCPPMPRRLRLRRRCFRTFLPPRSRNRPRSRSPRRPRRVGWSSTNRRLYVSCRRCELCASSGRWKRARRASIPSPKLLLPRLPPFQRPRRLLHRQSLRCFRPCRTFPPSLRSCLFRRLRPNPRRKPPILRCPSRRRSCRPHHLRRRLFPSRRRRPHRRFRCRPWPHFLLPGRSPARLSRPPVRFRRLHPRPLPLHPRQVQIFRPRRPFSPELRTCGVGSGYPMLLPRRRFWRVWLNPRPPRRRRPSQGRAGAVRRS